MLYEVITQRGLLVGSAPETFLGAGIQTALKLIEDGAIGRPVSATAFMMRRGHEHWHPDPEFYYAHGGGPMFDMGPYYLTTLIQLLGPISRIAGITGMALHRITSYNVCYTKLLRSKKRPLASVTGRGRTGGQG